MATTQDYIARLPMTEEFVRQEIQAEPPFFLYYYRTVCDSGKIEKLLIYPVMAVQHPRAYLASLCLRQDFGSAEALYAELMKGNVLIVSDDECYLFHAGKPINDKPGEAKIETTVQGPQSTFSENAETNIGIIRHRYPAPGFRVEPLEFGSVTRTKAYLFYDAHAVNPKVLDELHQRISKVDAAVVDSVMSSINNTST
ncbi:spore germination protein [Cohnella lubricantis]|uniref:Spore germination protein n=1 Tax=Cohnella lubricantis TaxID=2163172 RepID=A0A841TEX2_9BACL|nr:spore germination protein [Cohnella lubricantis]MBB6678529.1 spore germination protein [Cohnella lubricantis]MBP2119162.1 hypothetical protein [Cohnella lubricantis]